MPGLGTITGYRPPPGAGPSETGPSRVSRGGFMSPETGTLIIALVGSQISLWTVLLFLLFSVD